VCTDCGGEIAAFDDERGSGHHENVAARAEPAASAASGTVAAAEAAEAAAAAAEEAAAATAAEAAASNAGRASTRLSRRRHVQREPIQGAGGVGDEPGRDPRIARRRRQILVAEQHLYDAYVDSALQQMGGEAVPLMPSSA